jgi:hypothetical protein
MRVAAGIAVAMWGRALMFTASQCCAMLAVIVGLS